MKVLKFLFFVFFVYTINVGFSQDLIHMGEAGGISATTKSKLKSVNSYCSKLDPNDPFHNAILEILSDLGNYVVETNLSELELHQALDKIKVVIRNRAGCSNQKSVKRVITIVTGVRG